MSTLTTPKKNTEQDHEENILNLVSPYHNEIEDFDNGGSYPDMEFVVDGIPNPLLLHRKILANTSGWFRKNLSDKWGERLEWPYDTSKEVDRESLLKALRFCYGETLRVGTKNEECFALISALTRLQVTCMDNVVTTLKNFIVAEAKRNVETGVELLKMCSQYKECCDSTNSSLNKTLASVVFTKENMCEHYKEVVDECMMVLPPEYLMMADFGEPHTKCSEFCLKTRYVQLHSKELSIESKHGLFLKCDLSTLNSQELGELRIANVIGTDRLLEAYGKALEHQEIENGRMNEMMEQMQKLEQMMNETTKERDELQKLLEEEKEKRKKAEREREDLQKCYEKTVKGKEEVKKEVESLRKRVTHTEEERNSKAKEVKWLKKRLENADREREQHWNCVDRLEKTTQENCLFLIPSTKTHTKKLILLNVMLQTTC